MRIPLCLPSVGVLEEQAIVAALRSGWVAPAGPQLDEFESRLAAVTGRKHAVAVSSGTAALHLALLSQGIGAGDRVAVPTLTFAATVNAVHYVGAEPVFIDCDEAGLMDTSVLEVACSEALSSERPIRAVLPVDLYGTPADYQRIVRIAETYGAVVVSDAAESLGAGTCESPAGSFGAVAALSFNGNKIITTSSGGAVLCSDLETAERVRYLSTQARQPVLHYEHTEVGYNYRLSNLLAAVGIAQLDRLGAIVSKKREHHQGYARALAHVAGLDLLTPADGNCWMSVLIVGPDSGTDAWTLGESLLQRGIETRPVFKPMHLQPVHAGCDLRYITGRAEALYRTGLALPSSTDLTTDDRNTVAAEIAAAIGEAVTV
ncbi:aminotransferase class I/II-fold pyridoxal phosphate-dependent enzyme [Brevibacterium sp. JSBI002]|uniref:aminotransferase class I/II-fold pyridoxal phosphate-dependent enzyme n=1 Tax=Brevibacterium sp. JSBI002 TaxID=2886045 RepID=UPI00223027B3|nr:aminotransferase class I/II-fold pyridoxal phosphate-dependent enzyme [Brevibacterium sp. JSBI002]UZD62007.1 aminotransferase class I/II-fold pyridoxal phosphate-dependent enzyme [Brevibacterium sp. JSBI002]